MRSGNILGDIVNTSVLAVGTVTGIVATAVAAGVLYLPFRYTVEYFRDHENKNYSG